MTGIELKKYNTSTDQNKKAPQNLPQSSLQPIKPVQATVVISLLRQGYVR